MRIGVGTGLVCLIVGMAGCSGIGSGNIAGVNANAPPMSNIAPDANGVVAPPVVDSNQINQTNANATDGLLDRRRRLPVAGKSGPEVPLDFRPGPENSQTATTMNAEGQPVEVRVFNNNPQLVRVEAVWLGANDKLLKITLRDGATVEVKTDRVASLSTAPSDLLVELADGSK